VREIDEQPVFDDISNVHHQGKQFSQNQIDGEIKRDSANATLRSDIS